MTTSAAFRAGPALENALFEVKKVVVGQDRMSAVGAGAAALAWSPRSL